MTTDRQAKILQYLAGHGELEVAQLSQLLQVSSSTVRRELTAMEENGLLVRTHGAAQLPTPIHYEPTYESRAAQQTQAKRKIAAAYLAPPSLSRWGAWRPPEVTPAASPSTDGLLSSRTATPGSVWLTSPRRPRPSNWVFTLRWVSP